MMLGRGGATQMRECRLARDAFLVVAEGHQELGGALDADAGEIKHRCSDLLSQSF